MTVKCLSFAVFYAWCNAGLIERLQLCLYDVFLLALMIVGVCCFATKLSTNDAALQLMYGKYMTTNLLSNELIMHHTALDLQGHQKTYC